MTTLLDYLFGAATFIPHGVCLAWRPDLVALHAVSDVLIAAAYLAIPLAIGVFVNRRKDLDAAARRLAWLFAAFIVACALSHLAALVTLWVPAYGAQGLIKAATAGISLVTAFVVWKSVPILLTLPSPAALRAANLELERANAMLEENIARRTGELGIIRQRFEQALAGSDITVFSQDREFAYTWIHHPWLGYSKNEVIGRTDAELLPPETAAVIDPAKRLAIDSGEAQMLQVVIPDGASEPRSFDLRIVATTNAEGERDGVLCTAVDQTRQRRFERRLASLAAAESAANRRFEMALENSSMIVFEHDADLKYTYIHNPPPGMSSEDFIGRTDADLFNEEDLPKYVPVKRRVLETGGRDKFDLSITIGDTERFYDVTVDARRDENGKVIGLIGTAVDLTDRLKMERHMRLVLRELTHRSKNLLAIIQSMARQTAARADTMDAFLSGFSARLQAMAASHDLLVSRSWTGARLKDLLLVHLAQTVDTDSNQVEIDGPDLEVDAETAQTIGLALHELTTNAAKYGALSAVDGKVSVTFEVIDDTVRMTWSESGGPDVSPPDRQGFGTILLTRLIGTSLDGSVTLDFASDGLTCILEFPSSRLVTD